MSDPAPGLGFSLEVEMEINEVSKWMIRFYKLGMTSMVEWRPRFSLVVTDPYSGIVSIFYNEDDLFKVWDEIKKSKSLDRSKWTKDIPL
jgi:hypothetical protein